MKEIFLIMSCLYNLSLGCGNNTEDKTDLVVMSYNIRHCAPYYGTPQTTVANVSAVAEVIREKRPDVALLQEVDSCTKRSLGIDQIKELAGLAGYPYYYFFKQKEYSGGAYGAGMLSKYELKNITNHHLPREIEGQKITGSNVLGTAEITFNQKDICVAVTHLSVKDYERTRQFPFILAELGKFLEIPVIIGGDFNSKPDDVIISTLGNNGFMRTNSDPEKFTIPSNAPNRELDYIAFKPQAAFEVISHTVYTGISASDHLPIMSILKPL